MQQRWAGTRNAAATYALHIALGGDGERASTRAPHGSHSWRSESRPCDWPPWTRRWACATSHLAECYPLQQAKSLAFRRWGLPTCKRPRACRCKTKRDEMGRPDGETARQRDSEPARLVLRARAIPWNTIFRFHDSAARTPAGDTFRLLCQARPNRLHHCPAGIRCWLRAPGSCQTSI
jgi:hypothetical protein